MNPKQFDLFDLIVSEVLYLIESDIWLYPKETKRKSGEVVGSPRNIVDTRNLLENLVSFEEKDDKIIIRITDYSVYVHEGTSLQPPRAFIREALDNLGLDYIER